MFFSYLHTLTECVISDTISGWPKTLFLIVQWGPEFGIRSIDHLSIALAMSRTLIRRLLGTVPKLGTPTQRHVLMRNLRHCGVESRAITCGEGVLLPASRAVWQQVKIASSILCLFTRPGSN